MQPLISKIAIKESKEKVWEILLDKIHNPGTYIPGIEEFELTERAENEIIRTLYTELDDVVELIIIKPEESEITTSLVRHSFMKGILVQKIEETEEGVMLVFEQNREITLEELKGLDMQPALDAAVLQIKEKVEEGE